MWFKVSYMISSTKGLTWIPLWGNRKIQNLGHFSKTASLKLSKKLPMNKYKQDFSGSSAGESACNAGDPGSIPGLGRFTGEGIGYSLHYSWASLVAQLIKNSPAMWETWVRSLGWKDLLGKGAATHSSILAWRIPWTICPQRWKELDPTEQLSLFKYKPPNKQMNKLEEGAY